MNSGLIDYKSKYSAVSTVVTFKGKGENKECGIAERTYLKVYRVLESTQSSVSGLFSRTILPSSLAFSE